MAKALSNANSQIRELNQVLKKRVQICLGQIQETIIEIEREIDNINNTRIQS